MHSIHNAGHVTLHAKGSSSERMPEAVEQYLVG